MEAGDSVLTILIATTMQLCYSFRGTNPSSPHNTPYALEGNPHQLQWILYSSGVSFQITSDSHPFTPFCSLSELSDILDLMGYPRCIYCPCLHLKIYLFLQHNRYDSHLREMYASMYVYLICMYIFLYINIFLYKNYKIFIYIDDIFK